MGSYDPTNPYSPRDPSGALSGDNAPTVPYGVPGSPVRPTPPPAQPPSRGRGAVIALLGAGIVVLLVVLVAVLMPRGRSSGTVIKIVTGSVVIPTLTPLPGQTATPRLTTCAQLAYFAGAKTTSVGSANFTDAAFLAGSLAVISEADTESAGFQHRTLRVCSPNVTTDALAARYDALLLATGWTRATAADAPVQCAALCWQHVNPSGGAAGAIRHFLSIDGAQGNGVLSTYVMVATIAPLTAGTVTLTAGQPDFSADGTSAVDLHWVSAQRVELPNAALAASLTLPPGGFDAIHFNDLRAAKNFGGIQLTQDMLKNNVAGALKGTGGRLSKLLVTRSDAAGFAFTWVTYPAGF